MMKLICKTTIATAILSLGVQFSAAAGEFACTAIETTPDGKFTYNMQPGLKVLDEVEKPGAPQFNVPEATVAISCIRDKIIPVENDVEVLQAGYGLLIADAEKRMLSLSLEDGQVSYNLSSGELSKKKHKKVKKVIVKMQARLDFLAMQNPE